MIDDDALDNLRSAMFDYIGQHGLPTDRDALQWFQEVAREDTTPEQAFAPLYDAYFAGSGSMFTIDNWMGATTNLENILLRPDAGSGSVYFNFDFDFDYGVGEDGYSGERGAWGTV